MEQVFVFDTTFISHLDVIEDLSSCTPTTHVLQKHHY